MLVLGSLFPAMAWIFEPTLPSEEGAGWGDLPELLEFRDCPPLPMGFRRRAHPQPVAIPAAPHSDTPSHTPITPIPPTTPAHTRITNPLLHITYQHPAEVATSHPRKIVPSNRPTPPLAAVTDPLTPRTEQLLRLPLGELNSKFDMGWSRYLFAVSRRGQVQTWQRGERVSRSHFLSHSLEPARLIASATQPPKPRPPVFCALPSACPPCPMGRPRCLRCWPRDRPPCSLLRLPHAPPPPPSPHTHNTPPCDLLCALCVAPCFQRRATMGTSH